jgi:hypothetical protein
MQASRQWKRRAVFPGPASMAVDVRFVWARLSRSFAAGYRALLWFAAGRASAPLKCGVPIKTSAQLVRLLRSFPSTIDWDR